MVKKIPTGSAADETQVTGSVSLRDLATWCDVSAKQIRQMSLDGRLPPIKDAKLEAMPTVEALAKELARRRSKKAGGTAKDRLLTAQADLAELKLKRAAAEVLDRHAVTLVVTGLAIELRRVVQGLDCDRETKERVSKQLATITPEQILTRIDAEIEDDAAPDDEEG
jgi:phage terminase Nu1 subunit (DNA packaging protein)